MIYRILIWLVKYYLIFLGIHFQYLLGVVLVDLALMP